MPPQLESPLSANITKALSDKLYEKRKSAALQIENIVQTAVQSEDFNRIEQIINVLTYDFAYSPLSNSRNGGLIALAAVALALGQASIKDYLNVIVPPIIACMLDQDAHVRFYACESIYNVAKVARGEILIYFNDIFDCLSKLASDSEPHVRSGVDLTDRLIKDITAERVAFWPPSETVTLQPAEPIKGVLGANAATNYFNEFFKSTFGGSSQNKIVSDIDSKSSEVSKTSPVENNLEHATIEGEESTGKVVGSISTLPGMKLNSFNMLRFIPLLEERIHALSPNTRLFLVQWISLLDSIPDLELAGYIPCFLDGLFVYLSESNKEVRIATANLLSQLLSQISTIIEVQRKHNDLHIILNSLLTDDIDRNNNNNPPSPIKGKGPQIYNENNDIPDRASSVNISNNMKKANDNKVISTKDDLSLTNKMIDERYNLENEDYVYFFSDGTIASRDKIELNNSQKENPINSTGEYEYGQNIELNIGKMIEIILPYVKSTDEFTQATAINWLSEFILILKDLMTSVIPVLLKYILPCIASNIESINKAAFVANKNLYNLVTSLIFLPKNSKKVILNDEDNQVIDSSEDNLKIHKKRLLRAKELEDMINILISQFQDNNELTRVAALDWLLMLHKKAPGTVLKLDDSTFQALLRTLSDSSPEVVKRDIKLLAQISEVSDDTYLERFAMNMLQLFARDRKLLETKGALVFKQLCVSLDAERMFKTFAEILLRESDLEFASLMVQNLNLILITAPELSDLRRKLKNIDKSEGRDIFYALYKSWCHNAVAVLSLCLLAQQYEQTTALLTILADLEITVSLLIQVDKLVQLLESPIFTYLRMQLLEPSRYPHLYKCLYGILMLLPQSSAFVTLRNRLNAVTPIIYLPSIREINQPNESKINNRSNGMTQILPNSNNLISNNQETDTKSVDWPRLLDHFLDVQRRHERARHEASVPETQPSSLNVHSISFEPSNAPSTAV